MKKNSWIVFVAVQFVACLAFPARVAAQTTVPIALDSPNPEYWGLFGQSIAAADLNGDGKAEVIVAAPNETVNGVRSAGRVYIFVGPPNRSLRHW